MIERPTALLIDFDGVVRRHDPSVSATLELTHGVAPGAILAAGMEWDRLLPAITGRISNAEWLAGLVASFTGKVDDAAGMIRDWAAYKGEIAADVLAFVRDVRAAGLKVGLATNAMDDLAANLTLLGITGEFDAVANSSELGVHKPAPGYFRAACALIGTTPKRCLFIDDSDRNIRGARAAGLTAYRYTPADDLTYPRKALGLPV